MYPNLMKRTVEPMKEDKQKLSGVPFEEELEIFGEHKTREQVRAEEKERKILRQ